MTPEQAFAENPDQVEVLDQALADAWQTICETVDIVAEMPSLGELVGRAPLADPAATAEQVVVNMLAEAMEWVCRFSPWYTKPASAYGLTQVRDTESGRVTWQLSRQGLDQWEPILTGLAKALRGQSGLLHILLLVDELMASEGEETDDCAAAACNCLPPRVILVQREVLAKTEIRCDACHTLFRSLDQLCR